MHSAISLVQSDSNSHASKIPPKRKHTTAPWPCYPGPGAVFVFWPVCSVWCLCFVCLLFVIEVDNRFRIAFRLYFCCDQQRREITNDKNEKPMYSDPPGPSRQSMQRKRAFGPDCQLVQHRPTHRILQNERKRREHEYGEQ